jgi:hypothetical protein
VPILEELANILGCRTSTLPMKYLGLLLGANFKTQDIWNLIVRKWNVDWWGGKGFTFPKVANLL